ncbi:MAG: 4Fe-4S binding protein [Oscillospiraceae bacterium]
MIAVIDNTCLLCGACQIYCNTKALRIRDRKMTVIPELCTGCGDCEYHCFMLAISIVEQ